MRLRLRPAAGADLVAFAAKLFRQSSHDREPELPYEAWHGGSDAVPPGGNADAEVRRWLAIEDRQSRDLVGLVELILPAADGVPWIGLLVIEPRRRNAGLGGEAVAALEQSLAALGWAELRLIVALGNGGARRFWKRHGYREIADGWRRYDGLPARGTVLAKPLAYRSARDVQDGRRGVHVGA